MACTNWKKGHLIAKIFTDVKLAYGPVALPPFVNRMDFIPKFSQLSYHKQVSKRSSFLVIMGELHFVIGFYYIWNAICGRFHGLFQVLLFMHNYKGGHNQNWLIPVFWRFKVDKECVAVSINICPWQDPMQFGIKVPGTPCTTPGCRWDVSYVQQSRTTRTWQKYQSDYKNRSAQAWCPIVITATHSYIRLGHNKD